MVKPFLSFLKRCLLGGALCLFCLAPLANCSLAVTGTVRADGQADLEVKTQLRPKAAAILGSLSAGEGGASAVDADFINKGLSRAPGIERAALKNTSGTLIEGALAVRDIATFAAQAPRAAPAASRALLFEASSAGGKLALRLNRETGEALLLNISEDVRDYVSALFAPIATGEELSEKEYLELVASVYGKQVAEEMSASTITVTLRFPSALKSGVGARLNGDRATLNIPLVEALVLQRELYYEMVW